ncbi:MAG TPA: carbonic anhydrase [Burkholderiales bacterium]|nr:carbonic anhydrase [Burkholderiales bacterium]
MRVAALGGTAFLAVGVPLADAVAGKTEALLLSCMDFRLMNEVEQYMSGRGLRDNYDHIVLAGASLGALTDKYPAWRKTFWEHLDIAIKLHAINTVIVMDHRDCGAYKVLLGEDFAQQPTKETQVHTDHLRKLQAAIQKKYPQMKVELTLMALDGKVESIS